MSKRSANKLDHYSSTKRRTPNGDYAATAPLPRHESSTLDDSAAESKKTKLLPTQICFSLPAELQHMTVKPLDDYKVLGQIGRGTFGEVYHARIRETGEEVALKKILYEKSEPDQGSSKRKVVFPMSASREIQLLSLIKHPNVIQMLDLCAEELEKVEAGDSIKTNFFLVLEKCECDLLRLLINPKLRFEMAECLYIMKEVLEGLYCLHANCIIHRDVKPANVLVTREGRIKIGDFGMGKLYADRMHYTDELMEVVQKMNVHTVKVVTLWYRSPELLLGDRHYGPCVDVWAAGCMFAELFKRKPLLHGINEVTQFKEIVQMCGQVNPAKWRAVDKLPLYATMFNNKTNDHRRVLRPMLERFLPLKDAVDLIDKMLVLDPSRRIIVDNALEHDLFYVDNGFSIANDLTAMLARHKLIDEGISGADMRRNELYYFCNSCYDECVSQPPPSPEKANAPPTSKKKYVSVMEPIPERTKPLEPQKLYYLQPEQPIEPPPFTRNHRSQDIPTRHQQPQIPPHHRPIDPLHPQPPKRIIRLSTNNHARRWDNQRNNTRNDRNNSSGGGGNNNDNRSNGRNRR